MRKVSAPSFRTLVLVIGFIAGHALAQPDPSGIDFVTIGAPNNPAYFRDDPDDIVTIRGRGSVPYEYRMGRYEITSAQWLEFYNTFKARPDPVSDTVLPLPIPGLWGGQVDPTYSGPGTRYRLIPGNPDSGMRFAAGITWRVGAMYCNWLCNDKSSSLTAIQNGAYDTSTFGQTGHNIFTDQVTHNPGARYWIPTMDEWMKASYFDPSANGGMGAWWLNPLGSDAQPIAAPPPSWGGNGQANKFFQLPNNAQYLIPLGAYEIVGAVTPWGMLDAAGATHEWTEERFVNDIDHVYRYWFGSSSAGGGPDLIYGPGADRPVSRRSGNGLRIAAAVPTPTSSLILCGALCWGAARSRKRSL